MTSRLRAVRVAAATAIAVLLLVALTAAVLLTLPAAPARAAGCFPAGGQAMPKPPAATGDVVISGHGWGHGIGMSQWGAQGAAKLGCTVNEILTTYYPGVDVATAPMPDRIRVGIVPNRPSGPLVATYDVRVTAGSMTWVLRTIDPVSGEVVPVDATQTAGTTWRVTVQRDGSFVVVDVAAPAEPVLSGGDGLSALRATIGSATVVLPREKHTYKRGAFEFFPYKPADVADGMYVTLVVSGTSSTPAMDAYLYGLAEVPSSWEPAALQAQATVGRSYALAQYQAYRGNRTDCRCDLFDSTSSQHYTAWDKEGEATYGARWIAAVDATSGEVMQSGGRTATGFYASSHGGHSDTNVFVWGGTPVSYLQAVDDSRWDRASGNPNQAWSVGFSLPDLTTKLAAAGIDVGNVRAISLPDPRGTSGRVGDPARGAGGVLVQGDKGSTRMSGNLLRTALGLKSTLIEVSSNVACAVPADVDVDTLRTQRVAGSDRVATAVALSRAHWQQSDAAVVASAQTFPDALAGGALAAALDAPILLVGADGVPPAVAEEIARLGARDVRVLGGPAAVSDAVVAELESTGATVERTGGADRYETAGAVAVGVGPPADGTVLLALGAHPTASRAWPDAVAAGALQAGTSPVPMLLTAGGELPAATATALAALQAAGATNVLVVGGTSAIAQDVVDDVAALGLATERVSGEDRYGTSAQAAEAGIARGASPARLLAATGAAFPDALSAAAVAARIDAPLVLVDACDVARRGGTVAYLNAHAPFDEAVLVGGPAAVSERVRWQLHLRLAG